MINEFQILTKMTTLSGTILMLVNDHVLPMMTTTMPTMIMRMVTMTRRRMIVLPHGHESPHLLHTGGNDWRKHGAVFIRVVDVFLTSESFWGPIVVSFARVSKHFLFIAF